MGIQQMFLRSYGAEGPAGQALFQYTTRYAVQTWTAPTDVNSVSIVAVGGAGSGDPRLVLAVTGVAEYNLSLIHI